MYIYYNASIQLLTITILKMFLLIILNVTVFTLDVPNRLPPSVSCYRLLHV